MGTGDLNAGGNPAMDRVRTLFGTKNSRTFQGHSRAQFQFFKHSILLKYAIRM